MNAYLIAKNDDIDNAEWFHDFTKELALERALDYRFALGPDDLTILKIKELPSDNPKV